MPAVPDRAMVDQALAWHLRLRDADEEAWIAFAEWLDADPAHNDAYEAVADRDERTSPLLKRARFPTDEGQRHSTVLGADEEGAGRDEGGGGVRRNGWRWGALAASLAAAGVLGVQLLSGRDARYAIETPAGETRSVTLADGSRIALNGGTRIYLDKDDARSVEIARGEVRFTVKHDAADPFIVVAGEQRLVDIGTVFNVVRTGRRLRVGVAEGAVRFEAATRSVDLRAGDSLALDGRGEIRTSRGAPAAIGSWVGGRLVYDQASFEQVAEDLSRSVGISLELPRGMGSRTFSGVIQTSGGREMVRTRLEELIGETIVADGTRWSVNAR